MLRLVIKYLSIAGLLMLSVSCGETQSEDTDNVIEDAESVVLPDSLVQWMLWAEESSDGLWENDEHRFLLREYDIYGGQEMPPFFNVEGIAFLGDTMFVSDPLEQTLVAVSLETGEQFWKVGEQGEGPGHFNGVGEVAAGRSLIAVTDLYNCRISLISYSGEFLVDIPIQNPFDVLWKGDTLIALSLAEDKPLKMYSIEGEYLDSFGELPEELNRLCYINRHLHGVLAPDGSVLVISRFLAGIWRIDTNTGSTELFAETIFPQGEIVNDLESPGWAVLNRDIFLGPDGMVNVILPMFNKDGRPLSEGGENQWTTAIHRYNMEGEYLDSWVLDGTVGIALMHRGFLFTADRYSDGVVIAHDVVRLPS